MTNIIFEITGAGDLITKLLLMCLLSGALLIIIEILEERKK